MKFRTLLGTAAALTMTALAGLGIATPALAVYGPQTDNATVSASSVTQGGNVTVGGDQFCAGSTVTVTARQGGAIYITQKVRASNNGKVSLAVTLTEAGTNTITLTGRQSGCSGARVLGVKVGVRAGGLNVGSATAASGLPGTGGVNLTPLWAGLGLLAAGTLLVTAAQSRRRILV